MTQDARGGGRHSEAPSFYRQAGEDPEGSGLPGKNGLG